MEQLVLTEEELAAEAERLARDITPVGSARVVALSGDLGAGKTTFTKAFTRALGVTEHVTSPTFVIAKRYPLRDQRFSNLIHIDAYRLDSADELRKLDWDRTIAESGNIIVIEWADRVSELIPRDAIRISLAYLDEGTRTLIYGN